jgi:carboxyl-terminal processing protease
VLASLSLCQIAFGVDHAAAEAKNQAVALDTLALQGDFEQVLERLRETPEALEGHAAGTLLSDLERFSRNEQQREQERQENYNDAMQQVAERLENGRLDEAMVSAIEAHSIAADPPAVLDEPLIQDVVSQTQQAAEQAEQNDDWVEAAALYSRLNLLYEDTGRYRDDAKRIGRHIRLLHLYAPDTLQKLQVARAERLGDDLPEPPDRDEDENWQSRLNGVDGTMFREALNTASAQHIDHEGFNKLLVGAIQPLLTMLETPSLTETFDQLQNQGQAEAFGKQLQRLNEEIGKARPLNEFAAMSYVDRIFDANQRTINLPESVLAYEMTEGALSTLDDFTSMYWPEDVDFLSRSTEGSFSGIGVQIAKRDQLLTVVSPLNGTPAQAAGMKAGDVIAAVDGRATASWSLNKAVREITGPQGSEVVLTVERVGRDEPLTFKLTRDTIEIESIKGWEHDATGGWDYWLDQQAGIGYVRLTQFIPQSAEKLDQAIAELRREGELNSLILDLRHNPGGLLTSAIQIVNRFLDDGPILYTVDGNRHIRSAWNARKRGTYKDLNVVVLINQGSASASEIVSGALQDRGRAFVIGDRSYGKGSVQDVYWFPSPRNPKWGLKVTTQYYQLPGGRIIHRTPESEVWGIDPDLAVEVTNQRTAWGLELRQEIDVLRDKNKQVLEAQKSKPWVRLAGLEPVDPEAEDAEETVEIPVPTAKDLLELGLDPQLEAAMLLLKTQMIADDDAVAKR